MATEQKDIQRVDDTAANLVLGLINGQLGFATDGDRKMLHRAKSGADIKYWTPDGGNPDFVSVIATGDADTLIDLGTADTIAFDVGGLELLKLDGTGKQVSIITGSTTGTALHIGEVVNEGGYISSQNDGNLSLAGGVELVSGAWTARSISASAVYLNGETISFYCNNSLTDGNSYTPSRRGYFDTNGLFLQTLSAASSDTDAFLVSDSGRIKTRTGAQVLSDIGAISGSGTDNYLSKWSSGALTDSSVTDTGSLITLGANTLISGYLGVGDTATAGMIDIDASSETKIGLNIDGDSNLYCARFTGNSASSNSYGLLINAGTNSADAPLQIGNQTGATNFMRIRGDGQVQVPQISTGTDNSVVIQDSSGYLLTDEIDPKVWAGALVDYTGTPANNQIAVFTDGDTIEGDANYTWDSSTYTLMIESDDAGADYGPSIDLYRNSASEAVDDGLGEINFKGNANGLDDINYFSIKCSILDNDATSGDGKLSFYAFRDTIELLTLEGGSSAYVKMGGWLQLYQNYTAGAPTPTGYLVMKDGAGTTYKIPAEAL